MRPKSSSSPSSVSPIGCGEICGLWAMTSEQQQQQQQL